MEHLPYIIIGAISMLVAQWLVKAVSEGRPKHEHK